MLKSPYFSDYLKSSQVVFSLKARDKIHALEELLDVLVKQKFIANKKPILTRIIDRERLVSTAIGHGVALPHARVDTERDITIVVGKSDEGIEFDSVDKKKVRLVFLVLWNPTIPGLFNHLFAGLAQFLIRPEFRERLLKAKNKSEFHKILSEIELRIPRQEDKIISQAQLLWELQKIEVQSRKADKKSRKKFQEQVDLIREELDKALVHRFYRLLDRYGFAVAEVIDGVCQGCNINVATGIGSAIEGSNDIYVCENCGKFLVASKI
ncbi:PTS sugar transporter subunit IIA [Acidobacteriota bacterium]